MASTIISHNLLSLSHYSIKSYKNNKSILFNTNNNLKQQSFFSPIKLKNIKTPQIYAAQFNFAKVVQTAWKIGKDGVEAGTSLVPDSVPRPLAKLSVTVVTGVIVLFVLKSILSTAFFVLAMMGLIYFTYIALNKDEGPRGGGGGGGTASTDDSLESLEEARRIMEKYK